MIVSFNVQDNGHINYKVVLRAVHFVSMNERSPRICEVLLNILNCLLDLDIIESNRASTPLKPPITQENHDSSAAKTTHNGIGKDSEEITAHSIAMDSLFK